MRYGTPMQQMRAAARRAPATRGIDPVQARQPVPAPEPEKPEEPAPE